MERNPALTVHDAGMRVLRRIEKETACGITPRNAEQIFALHALTDPRIRLVSLSGKAGNR